MIGFVLSVYIFVGITLALANSYPTTDYTADDVARRALFWPLYFLSWFFKSFVRACKEMAK